MSGERQTIVKKMVMVPIYEVHLWIIIDTDANAARLEMSGVFGANNFGKFGALCASHEGSFGLFFSPEYLTPMVVCHEVFHLTHRILEWCGAAMDMQHQEHAACLHGYLVREVFSALNIETTINPLEVKS